MQPIDIMKEVHKHGLKIDFVKYGIASRIGDTILMNLNMPQYDKYCTQILEHEIRHTPCINKHNLMMDIFEGSFIDNLKFCFRHPLAFTQFVPFGKYKGTLVIDVNQLIIYVVGILCIGAWTLLMM